MNPGIFSFKLAFFTLLLIYLHEPVIAAEKLSDRDIKRLKKYMSGFFSSAEQAKNDSANYFEISLCMYPFEGIDKNGFWLYVEQAMSAKPNQPYRQRIYHVYKENDTLAMSHVYTLKHPENYIHSWNQKASLNALTMDSLEDRKGCSIYLRKINNKSFVGSTHKDDCESNLRGANYATSEVQIGPDMLISWDRGFNKSRVQVWGATKGGYRFIKNKSTFK